MSATRGLSCVMLLYRVQACLRVDARVWLSHLCADCVQALFGNLTLDVIVLTMLYSTAGLGIAIVNDFKSIEGDRSAFWHLSCGALLSKSQRVSLTSPRWPARSC